MISEILINRLNGTTRRIREQHTDDTGAVHIRSFDCALDTDVNAQLATNATLLLEKLSEEEAEQASEDDTGIVAGDFASIEQKALAYLRKAYSIEDPYQSYIRYNKFNNYRIVKGWSLAQVVAGLTSVGLTQDEWDKILLRYQYLSVVGRVDAMEDYELVKAGDNF